MGVFVIQSV